MSIPKHVGIENTMSRQAVLNQDARYYSQVMSLAYATNLSLDEVDKDIREVKPS